MDNNWKLASNVLIAVMVIGLIGVVSGLGAGIGIPEYKPPAEESCDVTVGGDISAGIESASPGDTVCVEGGDYTGEDLISVDKAVKVAALTTPHGNNPAVVAGFDVSADGATVKGFKVTEGKAGVDYQVIGIYVTGSNTKVANNYVTDLVNDSEDLAWPAPVIGIQVVGYSETVNDVEVTRNVIDGVEHLVSGFGAYGMQLYGDVNSVDVNHNVIKNVQATEDGSWAGGIAAEATEYQTDISLTYNTIEGIHSGGEHLGTCFYNDKNGDTTEFTIEFNNFRDYEVGVENKDLDQILDATRNYWGKEYGAPGKGLSSETPEKEVVGDVKVHPWLPNPVGGPEEPRGDNPPGRSVRRAQVESFSATPNPISSKQQVTFSAQGSRVNQVKVEVFNTVGAQVYNSNFQSGSTVTWNLVSNSGEKLANGLYFFSLTVKVDGEVQNSGVRRLLVIN